MDGIILGIDLCGDYSQISCCSEKNEIETISPEKDSPGLIPTVICKKKGDDSWFIGEEAYRLALFGGGTMVDKLLNLVQRSGFATIEGVRYTAEDLMKRYIASLFRLARNHTGQEQIAAVVYTVQKMEGRFLDYLVRVSQELGVDRDHVRIQSHTESFVYYVVSQPPEVWSNSSVLFDLTEDGLHYYEMRVIRGQKPNIIEAAHEKQEENFSLDVMDTDQGKKLADSIMTTCAKNLFGRKVISSVFLTGKGFVEHDWAQGFMQFICSKRKCFMGQQLFSGGAAWAAMDMLREKKAYPYILLCEGRIGTTVIAQVMYEGRREKVVLAEAGTNWYEARSRADFILDDLNELVLTATTVGIARPEKLTVPLGDLPARPNRTTRVEVICSFTSETDLTVRVVDKGFGDLFPATSAVIRRDFTLNRR